VASKNITINKPWGYEEIFANTEKYIGKIIYINQGHKLSRQYHSQKDESITVLSGVVVVEYGENGNDKLVMEPGYNTRIRAGTIHRFCASTSDVKLLEVSTPEMDDVVRLEDDYGRSV
tara:strand:+ start:1190 stop:1543 length:354 start_codon:yes stop_codon:yes gene_type:complete